MDSIGGVLVCRTADETLNPRVMWFQIDSKVPRGPAHYNEKVKSSELWQLRGAAVSRKRLLKAIRSSHGVSMYVLQASGICRAKKGLRSVSCWSYILVLSKKGAKCEDSIPLSVPSILQHEDQMFFECRRIMRNARQENHAECTLDSRKWKVVVYGLFVHQYKAVCWQHAFFSLSTPSPAARVNGLTTMMLVFHDLSIEFGLTFRSITLALCHIILQGKSEYGAMTGVMICHQWSQDCRMCQTMPGVDPLHKSQPGLGVPLDDALILQGSIADNDVGWPVCLGVRSQQYVATWVHIVLQLAGLEQLNTRTIHSVPKLQTPSKMK